MSHFRAAMQGHGVARISGAISRTVIRDGVRSAVADIRSCYENRSTRITDGAQLGRATLRFVIIGTGEVQSAELSFREHEDPDLESCIESAILAVEFPPMPGDGFVVVTYPLLFREST